MKRYLLGAIFILLAFCVNAQPPQGGQGGGRRPDGPPPGGFGQNSTKVENKPILDVFPDIPNITLEQREKVGSLLTKERKEIMKQMEKKREYMREPGEEPTEKAQKAIAKIDKKIIAIKEKTNKKVKKVLSPEQYLVFMDKREEFKFKSPQGGGGRSTMQNGERPPRPN